MYSFDNTPVITDVIDSLVAQPMGLVVSGTLMQSTPRHPHEQNFRAHLAESARDDGRPKMPLRHQ